MNKSAYLILFAFLLTNEALGSENWERRTSPEPLIKKGAVRLTRSEVRALIVGKTETWGIDNSGRQAGYYSPDGVLSYKYQNKWVTEKYTISGNGSFCFKSSGGCHYYLRYKNKIVVVWQGLTRGAKRYREGNKL